MKIYLGKSFSLKFRQSLRPRECLKFRMGNLLSKAVFLVILACENCKLIKPNRFCYYVQKGFRENPVSVIVSTFLIFMFVDQLLLVDVFSQLYRHLTYTKKHNVGLPL